VEELEELIYENLHQLFSGGTYNVTVGNWWLWSKYYFQMVEDLLA